MERGGELTEKDLQPDTDGALMEGIERRSVMRCAV